MNASVEDFISQCQQSSSIAYELFKKLLTELDNLQTRKKAFSFLCSLKEYDKKHQPKSKNFQFLKQQVLEENDKTVSLSLLQFPSTFLPEAWSYTFYEGLVRYPATEYLNKKTIELGCGIGWISIALAIRYSPERIYGLDINPKAIVCARLNLYLNSLNENGDAKALKSGKSLLDIVSFQESNLFSYFDQQPIVADKIIGCIPQVLNPEPDVMETLIAENASDEYLHSLSNYFAKQGYIEDQFGLGLIASAVEQSIPLLHANGKLILNLGGRPGRSVLERLMQRRGFKVRRVWQTQVEQAADTEINALVDIEKNTGHRFEFYMSENSDIPIDARTAQKYANSNGKIFHSVDVYEAELLFPEQVKSIYQSIDAISGDREIPIGQGLRSAIDLTYDNYDDAEERYSFLSFLAKELQKTSHFPYEDTCGLTFFRQQIAEFFTHYLKVDVADDQIVITPGRRQLLDSLLTNYCPKLTLVTRSLTHLIPSDFDNEITEVIRTPSKVEYLVELMNKLKPQLVITDLDQHEVQSSQLVEQIIQCAQQNNVLLVLDLTNNIDLSSEPSVHGVYRYLSENTLPNNIILMAGLINNHVYQNYSLNITLTSNSTVAKNLTNAAELTYSRTPVLKQLYYAHLLESLLFFQRTRPNTINKSKVQKPSVDIDYPLHSNAHKAFSHPAIEGNHLEFNSKTIRLDFGENELPAPTALKEVILESYLVRKWLGDDISVEDSLQKVLTQRFNISRGIYSDIALGNGVAPIYSALLNLCARDKRSLVIPSGSYGYFKAAAEYKNLDVNVLETNEDNLFKISPDELGRCLSNRQGCWLFLNAPIVNPTGSIYSNEELSELLTIAKKNDVTVIMDCIFSGLEFKSNLSWDLSTYLNDYSTTENSKLVIIGGVSKEYSAGGLRFGYAWSSNRQIVQKLSDELTHSPHFTLKYAMKHLLEAQLNKEPSITVHLEKQQQKLSKRAEQLSDILKQQGWKVIPPSGGLFLVAKPVQYIQDNQFSPEQGGDAMTKKLFNDKNIVINNSTWTGLPGYCRFVLSCSERDFEEAMERLQQH